MAPVWTKAVPKWIKAVPLASQLAPKVEKSSILEVPIFRPLLSGLPGHSQAPTLQANSLKVEPRLKLSTFERNGNGKHG